MCIATDNNGSSVKVVNNVVSLSSSSSYDEEYELPSNFTPGPYDVVCARGKGCSRYPGNIRFNRMIQASMARYSSTNSRVIKSCIVSEIVECVRNQSTTAAHGFVKKGKKGSNRWYTISDTHAREKVSQCLRDLLSNKYKSSTKAKQWKRRELNAIIDQELDSMIQSNTTVSQRLQQLNYDIQQQQKAVAQPVAVFGADTSSSSSSSSSSLSTSSTTTTTSTSTSNDDEIMSRLFNQANMDLLEALKRDATVVTNFNTLYATRNDGINSNSSSSSSNSTVASSSSSTTTEGDDVDYFSDFGL